MTKNLEWPDFYQHRINSMAYEAYFAERYQKMLEFMHEIVPKHNLIVEEGVGIASLAKAFHTLYPDHAGFVGFDNNYDMLVLAMKNTAGLDTIFAYDDILNSKWDKPDMQMGLTPQLVVTHGVLEHFTDEQIPSVLDRYANKGDEIKYSSLHYVPTDKYLMPSFGDERLLSVEHWLNLVKPTEWFTMNDGYDLVLYVKPE